MGNANFSAFLFVHDIRCFACALLSHGRSLSVPANFFTAFLCISLHRRWFYVAVITVNVSCLQSSLHLNLLL